MMPKVKGPRESSDVLRENHRYKGYEKKERKLYRKYLRKPSVIKRRSTWAQEGSGERRGKNGDIDIIIPDTIISNCG